MDGLGQLIKEKLLDLNPSEIDHMAGVPRGLCERLIEGNTRFSYIWVIKLLEQLKISSADVLDILNVRPISVPLQNRIDKDWMGDGFKFDPKTLTRTRRIYQGLQFSEKPEWNSFFAKKKGVLYLQFVNRTVPVSSHHPAQLLENGRIVTPLDLANLVHAPKFSLATAKEIKFGFLLDMVKLSKSPAALQLAWQSTSVQSEYSVFNFWIWRWMGRRQRHAQLGTR